MNRDHLLSFDGTDPSSRLQSHYVRVSSFEAEMLVFLNKIRRNRKLVMVDYQPESSRFGELS